MALRDDNSPRFFAITLNDREVYRGSAEQVVEAFNGLTGLRFRERRHREWEDFRQQMGEKWCRDPNAFGGTNKIAITDGEGWQLVDTRITYVEPKVSVDLLEAMAAEARPSSMRSASPAAKAPQAFWQTNEEASQLVLLGGETGYYATAAREAEDCWVMMANHIRNMGDGVRLICGSREAAKDAAQRFLEQFIPRLVVAESAPTSGMASSGPVTDEVEDMRTAVTRLLLQHPGWVERPGPGPGLAVKGYTTAVGVKEAVAYGHEICDDPASFLLIGDYQSEGRNALSTIHLALGPQDLGDAEVLGGKVARFVAEVDRAVAQTYAYGLLHNDADDEAPTP